MKFSYMDEVTKYRDDKAIWDLVQRMEKEKWQVPNIPPQGYDYGASVIAQLEREAAKARMEASGVTSGSRAKPSRKPTEKPSQTFGGKWRGHTGETPDPSRVTSEKHWPDGGVSYICRGGQVVYVP